MTRDATTDSKPDNGRPGLVLPNGYVKRSVTLHSALDSFVREELAERPELAGNFTSYVRDLIARRMKEKSNGATAA